MVYMGIREILNRIKKLEERTVTEDRVTLICLENGKECRNNVGIHEACMMALKQDTVKLFGLSEEWPFKIIGVESGDDDGFIMGLLDGTAGIEPEDVKELIEA